MIGCLLRKSGAPLPHSLFELLSCYSSRIEREEEVVYLELDTVKRSHSLWQQCKAEELCLGVATSLFVARVAALQGGWRVVYPGEESSFLAPLSIRYLPAEPETVCRLHLVGIQTMGQLISLGAEPLSDQFGTEGYLLWQLAQGIDERPLVADPLPFHLEEEMEWSGSGGQRLVEGIDRLFERLQRRGLVCLCLRLQVQCEDGLSHRIDVRYGRPIGDGARALPLAKLRLEELRLTGPPHTLLVAVVEAVPREVAQLSLFETPSQREKMAPILQRLSKRDNLAALMRVVWDEPSSPLPDRWAHLESLLRPTYRRPLLLPRPIEAHSGKDREPTQLKLKGRWQKIASLIERWEVDEGWWSQEPIQRTYYRTLVGERVVRLFCDRIQGLWYVH